MSSELFGFDINYFLYETSSPAATHQDHFFFEEEIASLVLPSPPQISQLESELRDAVMEVKREEHSHLSFGASFSSNDYYDHLFPFGPHFDRVLDSKNHFLQVVPPFCSEKSIVEEGNFKVGKYNKEERKWRIDRYRSKRTRRNFNKTIKPTAGKEYVADLYATMRSERFVEASLLQRCEDKYDL